MIALALMAIMIVAPTLGAEVALASTGLFSVLLAMLRAALDEKRTALEAEAQQAQLDSARLHLTFNEERRRRGFLVLCGCELCASRRFALRAARTCGDGDCDETGGCYRNKCGARGW